MSQVVGITFEILPLHRHVGSFYEDSLHTPERRRSALSLLFFFFVQFSRGKLKKQPHVFLFIYFFSFKME